MTKILGIRLSLKRHKLEEVPETFKELGLHWKKASDDVMQIRKFNSFESTQTFPNRFDRHFWKSETKEFPEIEYSLGAGYRHAGAFVKYFNYETPLGSIQTMQEILEDSPLIMF